jgi:hypothetical protein
MAIVEVSEDGVRRAAGGEVFGQAKEWVDKVSGLRSGGPVVCATVDGVPVSVRILPGGFAAECGCPAHGLCAHAVAAVLAWVRAGTDADELDLFEVLRMQDPDSLATRLAELAAADPALAGGCWLKPRTGKRWRTWRLCARSWTRCSTSWRTRLPAWGSMTSGSRTARPWTSCLTR